MEHARSGDPELARTQDRMNRIDNIVTRCDCNRPTLDSIRAAGCPRASLRPIVHLSQLSVYLGARERSPEQPE